jgi:hypothetical protein
MHDERPTVLVIGASAERAKFGNKAVRAHRQAGWRVVPMHRSEPEIEGLRAVRRWSEAGVERFTRVTVYLPAAVSRTMLAELAAIPCDEMWLNPGADAAEVVAGLRALGAPVVVGCSILDLGLAPGQFP